MFGASLDWAFRIKSTHGIAAELFANLTQSVHTPNCFPIDKSADFAAKLFVNFTASVTTHDRIGSDTT
jgi:hypothetical protein